MPRQTAPPSLATQLLRTKLHPPSPGARSVHRPRLISHLNQSAHYPLTLLSAPAGFGKTTLLAAWSAQLQTPRVAWLSLEPGDDDPARFLHYVLAAFHTVDPGVATTAGTLLQASSSVVPQMVLTTLLNSLDTRGERIILVLDDAHVLESQAVTALVAFLVEHCPPSLHLLLSTRTDPDLPLARYRARGHLLEIRAHDLRFTSDEVGAFLNTAMDLDLTRAEIDALEKRTEGWIAGLQLAALSMQDRVDRADFIAAFSGTHRFILDYLMDQVLSGQTSEIQEFLLRTSILGRMNAELCQTLTGQSEAQARLEWLEAHNLFLVPLDDERRWYRYHALFAEVLQHRLRQTAPQYIAELHRKASAWYLAEGQYSEAIRHALATSDFETPARILEQHGVQIALAGQPQTVVSWLDALPQEMIQTRPMLACASAAAHLLRDELELAGARLGAAERLFEENGTPAQITFVRTWRAIWRGEVAMHAGDIAGFVAASREGLTVADSQDPSRLPLLVRVARAFQLTGDVTEGPESELRATLVPVRAANNLYTRLNSIVYLARMQTLQGRLHQARATFELAAQAMPSSREQNLLVIHPVYYAGLADISREWNRLDEASELLAQGFTLTRTTLSVDADALMLAYTTQLRVQLARGETENADDTLHQLARVASLRHFVPDFISQIATLRARVELARGELDAALRWARGLDPTLFDTPAYPRELELLTWARVWLAYARHSRETLHLPEVERTLERWSEDAQTKKRQNSVIEISVLRAQVANARGDQVRALGLVQRALAGGESGNYLAVFSDEGEPMRRLLLVLRNRAMPVSPSYLDSVLSAFGQVLQAPHRGVDEPPGILPEPLSDREMEVLRLLVKGASNQEIADTLIIALPTVKRHISNIYAKLGVASRTQAAARAQELKLL